MQYHVIYTDLGIETVREAAVRMARMVETYRERTSAFSGRINHKLPFYMFRSQADYLAAGGLPGSGGVFKGDRLMMTVGAHPTPHTWRLMQHEGFHQFAHAVIRGNLPVWVDEGLAEYFGEGVFTGDGYVTGVVRPSRLRRVREAIEGRAYPPLREMMQVPRHIWNANLQGTHYDQAWSMIHFMAHGDGGKYEEPFNRFLLDVGRGRPWEHAWARLFGADAVSFEARWREYWLRLDNDSQSHLSAEAVVATMTSYFARAASQGQRFKTPVAFFAAARANRLKRHSEDWLPASLLSTTLPRVDDLGEWALTPRGELMCTLRDGTRLTGTYQLKQRRVGRVRVLRSGESK